VKNIDKDDHKKYSWRLKLTYKSIKVIQLHLTPETIISTENVIVNQSSISLDSPEEYLSRFSYPLLYNKHKKSDVTLTTTETKA
jgi:hypothetical protein